MKNIIWLASYPKSGNTWFRVFLANLISGPEPVNINKLRRHIPHAGDRPALDNALGIETQDLSFEESERLRPDYYRFLSGRTKEILFLKLHDAFSVVGDGRFLIPLDVTKGVIYLIRNPLDIAVSYANHSGIGIDRAIDWLNDDGSCLASDPHRPHSQLPQRLFSWSNHVRSWADGAVNFDFHLMRYEDMKQDTVNMFTAAVKFIGMDQCPDRIKKALASSGLDELRRQESLYGFTEKPIQCKSFFYKGEVGSWKDVLSDHQAQRIIQAHQEIMTRFGYLKNGEPVY